MKRRLLLSSLLMVCFLSEIFSQKNKTSRWNETILAGFNIGALSPIPLPNNIRKVKSYSPLLSPAVHYEMTYRFTDHWAVGGRIGATVKGMRVKDSVLYFHTLVQVGEGAQASSFEGAFTGTNETFARNIYLNLPLFAQFTPHNNWHFKLGAYAAYLLSKKFEGSVSNGYIRNGGSLGEKVEITSASFDFAEKQRTFDYGLFGGVSHDIGSRWQITGDLQWGLRRVFPASFSGISFGMYNVFVNVGAGFRL